MLKTFTVPIKFTHELDANGNPLKRIHEDIDAIRQGIVSVKK